MYKSTEIYDDKPHEECGVFGIFDHNLSAVHEVYYGIFALQHRGQEVPVLPSLTARKWRPSAAWDW